MDGEKTSRGDLSSTSDQMSRCRDDGTKMLEIKIFRGLRSGGEGGGRWGWDKAASGRTCKELHVSDVSVSSACASPRRPQRRSDG